MIYALWDTETGALTVEFPSEGEALAAIRDALERHGRIYAETSALARQDARGRPYLVEQGADLVAAALQAEQRSTRAS